MDYDQFRILFLLETTVTKSFLGCFSTLTIEVLFCYGKIVYHFGSIAY